MLKQILSILFLTTNCNAYNKFINNYIFNWSNYPIIVKNYLTKSSSNNPDCSYILGTLYLNGIILNKNLKKADYYITKAAESFNLPEAINSIGDAFYSGDIRKKDIKMALKYYEKAAKLGFGPSQFNAGIVLLKTFKNKYELKKAIFWLDKASKNRDDLKDITKRALEYKKDAENKLKKLSK